MEKAMPVNGAGTTNSSLRESIHISKSDSCKTADCDRSYRAEDFDEFRKIHTYKTILSLGSHMAHGLPPRTHIPTKY